MKCADVMPLIAAYADREVDRLQRHAIGSHLRRCTACAAQHEDLMALRERLRTEAPYYVAPADLRTRLQALVTKDDSRSRQTGDVVRERLRWLLGGALAGCAATVVAWFAMTAVVDWREREDVAQQAVAAHVRATLGARLVDVASSDQHRVKPWISARLDYSPPVPDLGNVGFPLVGGRLDTLGTRSVATLVYHYREHVIDVFVSPAVSDSLPVSRTVRGFNVTQARAAGMDWTAVSDVSPDVLSSFVGHLVTAARAPASIPLRR